MIFRVKGNTILAVGQIFNGDGVHFMALLNDLENVSKEIEIQLHTVGGSVFDGNLMINAMQNSPAKISLSVIGLAASMGAFALTAVENVSIVENGYVMIHRPSSMAFGNAEDLESEAKLLRMMEADFEKRLIKRTGQKAEVVKEWLSKDSWFSAEEALKSGLVKKIIPSIVEPVQMEAELELETVGELEVYNRYACALLTDYAPTANFENRKNIEFEIDMKQLLITALALAGLTAQSSDTAVVSAVEDMFKDLNGQLDVEKQARKKAEEELSKFRAQQIDAMVDRASKSAPTAFSEDEKKVYQNIGLTSGVEALSHVLEKVAKPQAPNITGQINGGNANGREAWDFDKWQKEDPRGLEKMSAENPEAFKKLFNEKYS